MSSQSPIRRTANGFAPFALSVPIGLSSVVLSFLLGVRDAGLSYPGGVSASVVTGAAMGALIGWRSRQERTGRTMDLGSGWRAPLLGTGILAAALLFADQSEKSELVLYAGLFTTSVGLAGALVAFLLRRRGRTVE